MQRTLRLHCLTFDARGLRQVIHVIVMSIYKSLNNMDCMFVLLLPINVHFRCLIVLRYYNQLSITVRQCPVLQCPVRQCPVLHCPVRQCPVLQCPPLRTRPSLSSPAMSNPVFLLVRQCPVLQFQSTPRYADWKLKVSHRQHFLAIARSKLV